MIYIYTVICPISDVPQTPVCSDPPHYPSPPPPQRGGGGWRGGDWKMTFHDKGEGRLEDYWFCMMRGKVVKTPIMGEQPLSDVQMWRPNVTSKGRFKWDYHMWHSLFFFREKDLLILFYLKKFQPMPPLYILQFPIIAALL